MSKLHESNYFYMQYKVDAPFHPCYIFTSLSTTFTDVGPTFRVNGMALININLGIKTSTHGYQNCNTSLMHVKVERIFVLKIIIWVNSILTK